MPVPIVLTITQMLRRRFKISYLRWQRFTELLSHRSQLCLLCCFDDFGCASYAVTQDPGQEMSTYESRRREISLATMKTLQNPFMTIKTSTLRRAVMKQHRRSSNLTNIDGHQPENSHSPASLFSALFLLSFLTSSSEDHSELIKTVYPIFKLKMVRI